MIYVPIGLSASRCIKKIRSAGFTVHVNKTFSAEQTLLFFPRFNLVYTPSGELFLKLVREDFDQACIDVIDFLEKCQLTSQVIASGHMNTVTDSMGFSHCFNDVWQTYLRIKCEEIDTNLQLLIFREVDQELSYLHG